MVFLGESYITAWLATYSNPEIKPFMNKLSQINSDVIIRKSSPLPEELVCAMEVLPVLQEMRDNGLPRNENEYKAIKYILNENLAYYGFNYEKWNKSNRVEELNRKYDARTIGLIETTVKFLDRFNDYEKFLNETEKNARGDSGAVMMASVNKVFADYYEQQNQQLAKPSLIQRVKNFFRPKKDAPQENNKVDQIEEENARLRLKSDRLREENEELKSKNKDLQEQNAILQAENTELEEENRQFRRENDELQKDNQKALRKLGQAINSVREENEKGRGVYTPKHMRMDKKWSMRTLEEMESQPGKGTHKKREQDEYDR